MAGRTGGTAVVAGGQRPLVVAVGASNLSRGLARLVAVVNQWAGGPVDLLVAAGHGRSFGANSRVWNRRLPSVLGCGLWRSLDRLLVEDTEASRFRVAVVTDLGNDLLYGFSVEQLAGWVEETLVRLRQRGFRVAITRLPLASINRVGPVRYRLLKAILVPGCPLSLAEIKSSTRLLNEAVGGIAASQSVALIDQPGSWYGFDAMHPRRPRLDQLWQQAAASWSADVVPRGPGCPPTAAASWSVWSRVGLAAAEVRSLSRVMRFTPQPAVQLPDGTRVFLY